MPDTDLTQEQYLEEAQTIPLLREVIEGKKTFRSHLESIIAQAEISGGFREDEEDAFGEITWLGILDEYDQLTEALTACGEGNDDGAAAMSYLEAAYSPGSLAACAAVVGVGSTAIAALSIIPPFTPVVLFMGLVGGGVTGWVGSLAAKEKKTLKCRDEILAPLYAAADRADSAIAQCFPYRRSSEEYRPLSEDEEEAYRAMDAPGRQAVEAELRRRLAIGCLDMGEAELEKYLRGLLDDRIEGEAEVP